MKLSTEQQQELLGNLPDHFKQAVIRFDWKREIIGIGRIFELSPEHLEELETQTFLMMTGELPSSQFESVIIDKLDISESSAERLMGMINTSIFSELQKYAEKYESELSPETEEIIDHYEIKNVLADEGIRLVDGDEIVKYSPLHDEIAGILSNTAEYENDNIIPKAVIARDEVISENHNNLGISSQARNDNFSQNAGPGTQGTAYSTVSYHEPIEEKDLQGIKKHRIDEKIINQNNHSHPNQIFNTDHVNQKKKVKLPTLDQHLFENPFIAKGDSIDVSPSKEEQISNEGTFLEHLKTTE